MRFSILSIVLLGLSVLVSSGCRSTTPIQCEREMALLRAEILDLEDKYYALKSGRENGANITGAISGGMISGGTLPGSMVVSGNAWPTTYSGEVIYEDQYIDGQIIDGQVINGQIIDGQIINNGVILPGVPMSDGGMIGSGIISAPTLAPTPQMLNEPAELPARPDNGIELQLDDLPPVGSGGEAGINDQTTNVLDGPQWEIGFESTTIDSDSQVDRIEILSSQTRGKNLDGKQGDDGVEVMVQPLDIDGYFVDAAGELTVTVVDAQAGQLGKWTFLPAELKLFLSRDEFDNTGILLHLPWADTNPVSSVVEVQVKMVVAGRAYSDAKRVRIEPSVLAGSGSASKNWTGRDGPAESLDKPRSTSIERPQWKPVR